MIKKIALFTFWLKSIYASSTLFVAIAGGTGSGKTTLAKKIHERFPEAILISQDAYYRDLSHLSLEDRAKVNFDHPDALEFSLLKSHILMLKKQMPVHIPIYDFCHHTRIEDVELIEPSKIVLVEGILLFAVEEVRDLFDLKIYVDTDSDERILRRAIRDIQERGRSLEEVQNQYIDTVKPMHEMFVEPSKKYADIIIPASRHSEAAIDFVIARLSQFLSQSAP
ncbi:MAG: uridine kinase [Chlamydiae bacterium]|nr:uridine kinase [Chlamydiota bacterium]